MHAIYMIYLYLNNTLRYVAKLLVILCKIILIRVMHSGLCAEFVVNLAISAFFIHIHDCF
jgi:hypothetical protein